MDEQITGLPKLSPTRRTGAEAFQRDRQPLPLTVCDFWQWSASDLLSNLTRGRLAEFIVAHALGIDVRTGVRNEWDAFDLVTRAGVKVEVKSCAYLQSWHQKKLSNISWRLGPTRAWDAATNMFSRDRRWNADVYVLALLEQKDKNAVDPLDVAQWRFFVVPVRSLQHQSAMHVMTLREVKALVGDGVGFDALASEVEPAK